LGFGVRVGKDEPAAARVGEYYWVVQPHASDCTRQDLIVVALEQFMPNRRSQTNHQAVDLSGAKE